MEQACVQKLCDPEGLALDRAVGLAREIARIEPTLDLELARAIGDGVRPGSLEGRAAERALDILAAVSDARRLAPMRAELANHVNPHVRAKARWLLANVRPKG